MTPKVISESATEPILLAEVVLNLGLQPDDGNSPPGYVQGPRVLSLITTARRACEEELEMSLVAKTLEIAVPTFADCSLRSISGIELPWGPVRSIVSVNYVSTAGVDTVLAADQYRFSTYDTTAVLWPAYGASWPTARNDLDSVRVRYTAGYPVADSPPQTVPEPIRQAMHLLIAHWFANRDAVDVDTLAELPQGVCYLLGKYRSLGV
jgi:uncharacterized phiE125 gp8 family phage protein